jgi:hypothetical protein
MIKRERKIFYFLLVSNVYCLISGWFNGGDKVNFPSQYFWHFLAWWCTWNSILTIGFVLWKLIKRPKNNNYFYQVFSLIVMISNIITMLIYGLGLVIWLLTALTTYWGITSQTTKLVPIPSHIIDTDYQLFKVIQWWFYSPLWHFVAPTYFIVWFFRRERTDLLKKKLKLTILLCLIQPALYFSYGYLRSRLGDREYLKNFKARWVLPFFSSKKMSEKLGINQNYRFVWKIILVLFWFSLFSLLVYLILKYRKKIKNYLVVKKENLAKKKSLIIKNRKKNNI